jgi:hypothetical protein
MDKMAADKLKLREQVASSNWKEQNSTVQHDPIEREADCDERRANGQEREIPEIQKTTRRKSRGVKKY